MHRSSLDASLNDIHVYVDDEPDEGSTSTSTEEVYEIAFEDLSVQLARRVLDIYVMFKNASISCDQMENLLREVESEDDARGQDAAQVSRKRRLDMQDGLDTTTFH